MDQAVEEHIIRLERALLSLDRREINALLEGVGTGAGLSAIEAVMVPALERIGEGWEKGRVSLSQVYMSGRLCEELIDSILPPAEPGAPLPPIAIVALDDYHLLGKRLVYSALRSAGIPLLDYGRLDTASLVLRAKADGIRILLVSVLMLRSAMRVTELRTALEAAGCRVKLVVGGAPFRLDPHLWSEVGADGTAGSAAGAVAEVRRLIGGLT
jgi:methanogenic corrinoid protein MtbC1